MGITYISRYMTDNSNIIGVAEGGCTAKRITVKDWNELVGLEGVDRWGNKTKITGASMVHIEIATCREESSFSCFRQIYLETAVGIKGGRDRVLEELRECGFNIRYVGKVINAGI